jgi:hypothetical protein
LKEERVKSALELAMEKISGLPELTPEEIAEQKEKEYGPVGEAIAAKYLNGTITNHALQAELDKHSQDAASIVRRALITCLCRELRLDNDGEFARRALQGVRPLASGSKDFFEEAERDFQEILSEYMQEKEKRLRKFEIRAKEKLAKIWISGSALRPNLNVDRDWQRESIEIRHFFEQELERLRNSLIERLQSA